MTNGPTDRLDRIEAILTVVAESQQRTQQQVDANSSAMAEMREQLRLADERSRQRLEETTSDVVEMISNIGTQISETRAIADSNARAIHAWGSRIDEVQQGTEDPTTPSTGANLGTLSRLVQGLLAKRREDWRQWREEWQTWQQQWQVQQAESNQRFENLLQDAREDRRRNEADHNAFRENMQNLAARDKPHLAAFSRLECGLPTLPHTLEILL